MEDSLTIRINETKQVTLQSRGAMGLQLLFRISDSSVVDIKRIDSKGPNDSSKTNIGGSIPAVFEIRGLKAGKTNVEFYETQPWNKNFKDISQKEMLIEVIQP